MSKQQRHEQRKVERARRRRHPLARHGAAALSAAAAIAAGTQAYASPVRFDNPPGIGHFDWTAGAMFLDITLDAISQAGVGPGPSSLYHVPSQNGYVSGCNQGPKVQRDWPVLVSFSPGELIGSGGDWANYAFAAYSAYGYPGQLPEGVPAYLGARIDLGRGFQYGWIGVVMTNLGGGPPTDTIALDAFAWGYETQPGVPIPAGAIPEPGALALLAFGAAGLASRRRRKVTSN